LLAREINDVMQIPICIRECFDNAVALSKE
jgi:hypothetical protein